MGAQPGTMVGENTISTSTVLFCLGAPNDDDDDDDDDDDAGRVEAHFTAESQ